MNIRSRRHAREQRGRRPPGSRCAARAPGSWPACPRRPPCPARSPLASGSTGLAVVVELVVVVVLDDGEAPLAGQRQQGQPPARRQHHGRGVLVLGGQVHRPQRQAPGPARPAPPRRGPRRRRAPAPAGRPGRRRPPRPAGSRSPRPPPRRPAGSAPGPSRSSAIWLPWVTNTSSAVDRQARGSSAQQRRPAPDAAEARPMRSPVYPSALRPRLRAARRSARASRSVGTQPQVGHPAPQGQSVPGARCEARRGARASTAAAGRSKPICRGERGPGPRRDPAHVGQSVGHQGSAAPAA